MRLKIACCILIYITVNLVNSKSISKKHGHKQAFKSLKEPKKRISTQQKAGSGHAKGPMANNIQSSVPFPIIAPFPLIPFDDRYPILLTPNGKSKKGRDKKKDPKGETEDEEDKDVDDKDDEGGKEYDRVNPGSGKEERKEEEDDESQEEESTQSQNGAENKALKQLKVILQGNNEEDNEDDNDDSNDSEKNNRKETYDEKGAEKDDEEDDAVEDERDEKEDDQKEEKTYEKNDEEERNSKVSRQKSRNKRAIYKPIIGHPEDIMPYLMLGNEEQEVMDGKSEHKVTTRDTEEEQPDMEGHDIRTREVEEQEIEKSHVINTRDVDAQDDEEPHIINTREVNAAEEDEEEARDIRPRSLPDDTPDVDTAEKKFKDTQLAADVLTQIQKALGANPENSVEETHSLSDFLRKSMESYDEAIAKDILLTQNAQTRSKINDDGKKESAELTNATRKLENDRAKEREIQQELKELKDVELITTELELAKYLATENARHQVQFARAFTNSRPPPPPPPPPPPQAPPPVEYAPFAYQQPTFSYMQAPSMEVQRQPVAMAAPWQQYPQTITYAYSPSHVMSGSVRNEMGVFGGRNEPSYVNMNVPQAFQAHPFAFQQAIETPKPSSVIHANAESRHMQKPTKQKQYKQRKPFKTRFYPKPKPYYQSRVSSNYREKPFASFNTRKPAISFPGPTYSPPPLWARAGQLRGRYTSHNNQQYQTKHPASQALQSFFTQQHQAPAFGNMYQAPAFTAQQHSPLFTEETYKLPMATPMQYHVGEYHSVEKEQPHFEIHAPFISQMESSQEYHVPSADQHVFTPARMQMPAPNTQIQMPEYNVRQSSIVNQYIGPQPRIPSFVSRPQLIYPNPTSVTETAGSSKGGIPFYTPYYAMQQPAAPVQQQFIGYAQAPKPFQTMNTDSDSFHSSDPPVEKAPTKEAKAKEQENVPLGYGLYPLPENAEGKMNDNEEEKLSNQIKEDTEKLSDTKQAAMAVTKIENKVGFDPGSIAKLVDFVKQAAQRDVSLSERATKRDQLTIKKMEIQKVNDKKSDIGKDSSIATKEAQEKLKIDNELLKEAKDRLEKIKKMELIVTSIEAAKYSALSRKQEKLDNDVKQINSYEATKKTVVGRKGFGKRAS